MLAEMIPATCTKHVGFAPHTHAHVRAHTHFDAHALSENIFKTHHQLHISRERCVVLQTKIDQTRVCTPSLRVLCECLQDSMTDT